MNTFLKASRQPSAIERALNRIEAEIREGLRHGYFDFTLTCEIVSREQRCLTLRVGKSYQFLIAKDDCLTVTPDMGAPLDPALTRRIAPIASARPAPDTAPGAVVADAGQ